jgi:hypothetical protein
VLPRHPAGARATVEKGRLAAGPQRTSFSTPSYGEEEEKSREKRLGRRREEERRGGGEAVGEERDEKIIFVTDVLVPHVIIKIGSEKKGLLLELDPKNEAPKSWGSSYSLKQGLQVGGIAGVALITVMTK